MSLPHIPRRTALRWMLTATATASALHHFGIDLAAAETALPLAKGYGNDADLTKNYKPGDFWPLTFKENERDTAAALADVILPADDRSPAASSLGVVDVIDEFVSSPYQTTASFKTAIPEGLRWLNKESQKRFEAEFRDLTDDQKHAICDDVCLVAKAKPDYKAAAEFFTLFRALTMVAFYTTPEGMKDVGYIGNVPLPAFEGPPPELLKKLGLEKE